LHTSVIESQIDSVQLQINNLLLKTQVFYVDVLVTTVELVVNLYDVEFGQTPRNRLLYTFLKSFATASEKLVLVLGFDFCISQIGCSDCFFIWAQVLALWIA